MMLCADPECERAAWCRGLCSRHYIADQYRDKPPPNDSEIADRLFPKIVENPDTNCWEWQGRGHARTGHGMFYYNALGKMVTRYVHIWMWEFLVGPIPEGLQLDHLCRVTNCCNPVHLEPVTSKVNTLRGEGIAAVNARKTECVRGHPLDGPDADVFVYRDMRYCRACKRIREREKRASRQMANC